MTNEALEIKYKNMRNAIRSECFVFDTPDGKFKLVCGTCGNILEDVRAPGETMFCPRCGCTFHNSWNVPFARR